MLQMSEVVGDFPLVHPAMYGKQTRYAYIAMTDTQDSAAQNKVRNCNSSKAFRGAFVAVALQLHWGCGARVPSAPHP